MAKNPKVEFVNDWQKLEAAVSELEEVVAAHDRCDPDDCDLSSTLEGTDIKAIVELVPRLIKAYEELWENTMTMMKAWESFVANQTPAGLYLPDPVAPTGPLTAPLTGK